MQIRRRQDDRTRRPCQREAPAALNRVWILRRGLLGGVWRKAGPRWLIVSKLRQLVSSPCISLATSTSTSPVLTPFCILQPQTTLTILYSFGHIHRHHSSNTSIPGVAYTTLHGSGGGHWTELLGLTLAHGSTGVTLGLHFPLIPISRSVDYEHFLGINTFYTSGIGSIVMNGKMVLFCNMTVFLYGYRTS